MMHRVAAWTHGLQRATPMVAGAASARCWRRTYPVDRPTSAATGWSLSMCRCRRGRRRAARSASVARAVTWTGLVSHSMGLGCSAMGASSGATVSAQGSSRPRQRVTTSSAHAPPAPYYSPLTTYYLRLTIYYLPLGRTHYLLLTTHYSLLTYHLPLTTYYYLLPRYACPSCSAYEASVMKRSRPSMTLEEGKEAGLCGTPGCELPDHHQARSA